MQLRFFFALLMSTSISLSMPFFLQADSGAPLKKTGYIQQIQDAHSKEKTTAQAIDEANSSPKPTMQILETPPNDQTTTLPVIAVDSSEEGEVSSGAEDYVETETLLTTDDKETQSSSAFSDDMQVSDTTRAMESFEPSCCTCCYIRPECHLLPEAGRAWWGSAEFLYWRASAPSLDFGVSNNQPDFQRTAAGTEPQNGLRRHLHKAEYDWEPGFRITAGRLLPHDCWELFANYTWYLGKGKKTIYPPSANGTQGIYPLAQLVSTIADVTAGFVGSGVTSDAKITSNIHLHYQVANLLLARLFSLSKYLDLKISAGLQGGWISQKWKVVNSPAMVLIPPDPGSPPPAPYPTITNRMNWDFGGGGLQIGANTNWYLCESLHLYLNGAFSMLYGQHSTHFKTASSPGYFFITNPINDIRPKDMRIVTETQLAIGLSWTRELDTCNLHSLEIFAGYELHCWSNLHEVYRNTEDLFQIPHDIFTFVNSPVFRSVDTGPLILQGINVGVSLSF